MSTTTQYTHITAAAQSIAKRYHNGIAGLALAMKKNPTILANKLNPNAEQNQLSLEEAAAITDLTQDPAIADALAALVGRVTVALPAGPVTVCDLKRTLATLLKELGDVASEVTDAERPDSEWGERLSPAESKRIAAEIRDVLSVGAGMLQQVEG